MILQHADERGTPVLKLDISSGRVRHKEVTAYPFCVLLVEILPHVSQRTGERAGELLAEFVRVSDEPRTRQNGTVKLKR